MKNIGKFAVLGAVLAASASFAHADTLAASYGLTTGYVPPYALVTTGTSAVTYVGDITYSSVAAMMTAYPTTAPTTGYSSVNTTAYDLDPGTAWAKALGGSSYVGFSQTAGPVGTVDPTYGFYKFTTTLSTNLNGSLNVYADDTTEVLLGNSILIPFGTLGGDGHCADGTPNCVSETSVAFSGTAGQVLTFIVQQAGMTGQHPNQDPSGFDYTVTAAPEPSSLMLLGTGLMSAAGMMFRRRATV